MPVITNFPYVKYADGNLDIGLASPTAIGGWNIHFEMQKRFGGVSGIITRSCASGFYGSGITLIDSGAGQFRIPINSVDTSGLEYGNYAFIAERRDSGFRTVLAEGYLQLEP